MLRILNTITLLFCVIFAIAQEENKLIREGNKHYDAGKFTEAEKSYKQAGTINNNSFEAQYNLGNSLFKQKKYEEAAKQFEMSAEKEVSADKKSSAYHNLGNSLLEQKKYEESINAYKKALKQNPKDEDTRYNLSYAQRMIKQQQNQQNKDKKDDKKEDKKDDKKDQNKDKNEQDKKDDKKEDQKDQNQDKDGDKKEDKNQQQQQKPNQISKEDAQRILEELNKEEKDLQNKKKGKLKKGVRVKIEKDW